MEFMSVGLVEIIIIVIACGSVAALLVLAGVVISANRKNRD